MEPAVANYSPEQAFPNNDFLLLGGLLVFSLPVKRIRNRIILERECEPRLWMRDLLDGWVTRHHRRLCLPPRTLGTKVVVALRISWQISPVQFGGMHLESADLCTCTPKPVEAPVST